MPSRNFEIIREAIRNHQQIHATYKGRRRLMCPHVVGTKNGREKALFYQFAGESESGLLPPYGPPHGSPENWRCVFVSALSDVVAVPGAWHTALRQTAQRQTCVDHVIAEVTR